MKKYIALALGLMMAPAFSQDADAPKKPDGDRKARAEQREARRAEMIKKYDKDGDGKLSDEERKAMQADHPRRGGEGRGEGRRGPRMTDEQRAEMLKKYDKDGDGKLSDEERKAMMEDRKKAREERAKKASE